jgi:hypothetical protein
MIPVRETIQSILELVKFNPETSSYAYRQFSKMVDQYKVRDTFNDFLNAFHRFTQEIYTQYHSIGDIWRGKPVRTPQENLARAEHENPLPDPVPPAEKNLILEIVVKSDGKLDRAYKLPFKNDVASTETYNYLDYLFQSWMAKNHIQRQNGLFYAPNADGSLNQLTADELQKKMADATTGFAPHVDTETKNRYKIQSITLSKEFAQQAAVQQTTSPAEEEQGPGSSSSGR